MSTDAQERAALADRLEVLAKRARGAGLIRYEAPLQRIADGLRRGIAHPGWRALHAICDRAEQCFDERDQVEARHITLRAVCDGTAPGGILQ